MAIEDRLDRLTDALEQFIDRQPGASGMGVRPKRDLSQNLDDPAAREALRKNIGEYTKGLKQTTVVTKSLTNVFDGAREDLNFEQTRENFDLLDKQLAKTKDAEEVREIQAAKGEILKAVTLKTGITAAANFAGGMLKAANMILDASRAFELSIQSGASGVEAGTQNLIASIQANKQIQDTQADVIKDTSQGIGMLAGAFGKVGKIIGGFITLFGPLVSSFMKFNNDQEAKAAEHRAKLYGEELKKTEENYNKITAAGAMFANGMGEMRAQAANAGMRVKDFGDMIKNSSANLADMGMGLAQAAQRIGGVSKVLRTSDLGMQLRNLGLNAQEQAEAAAGAAANLNATGQLRSMSDQKVAEATVAYTKDLKILAAITGEDAKKKMEEARKRSMEADLMAQTLAKGGPLAMAKLRDQLATMPESLKKGYMEFVSTGGTAVADAATNVAIAQNPKIMAQYQQMFTTLGDGNKDASAAMQETGTLTEQTAKYAREHAASVKEMGLAARVGASDIATATMTIHNDLILANQKFTEGVTAATAKNVEDLSKTQDPLTKSMTKLQDDTDKAAVALEQRLTPALAAAADAMPRFTGALKDAYEALTRLPGQSGKSTGEVVGEVGGTVAGSLAGAVAGKTVGGYVGGAIGSLAGPGGTVVGAMIGQTVGPYIVSALGGLVGGYLGEKTGGYIGQKFADGGIAKGPQSGFAAMLHGTEAVVPLPDGKALPVNLDLGNSSLLASIGKLTADDSVATNNTPNKLSDDTAAMIRQLTDTISAYNRGNDNTASNKALEDMASLMKSQLDKHDEMISHLKETVDINQRLLNQSYA
jgi:hypothetical protein